MPNTRIPSRNCQRLIKFCVSRDILANLATLSVSESNDYDAATRAQRGAERDNYLSSSESTSVHFRLFCSNRWTIKHNES